MATVRIKGMEPDIRVYRKHDDSIVRLEDESVVKNDDLLQISYVAAGKSHGAIVSVDGRGVVTLHYPEHESAPLSLESDGEVALKYSYRLDDAPDFERFFFITGSDSFSLKSVLQAAEALAVSESRGITGYLKLPENLEQVDLLLSKEVSR